MTALEPDWKILQRSVLCETPHLSVCRQFVATPSHPGGVEWIADGTICDANTLALSARLTSKGLWQ